MRLAVCCVFSFAFLAPPALAQDAPARVTVLYDAFGKPGALLEPVRCDIPRFRKIVRDFGIQPD